MAAVDRCRGDDAGTPPLGLEGFRRDMLELDLWPSFCLLAQEGAEPIGVLLTAKRAQAAQVLHLAVHAEHRRRGHAAHMLDSLKRKMAVLGPPRLGALLPGERADLATLFASQGLEPAEEYADYVFTGPGQHHPLVAELPAAAALALDFVRDDSGWCWPRSLATLRRRAGALAALGLAGVDGWLATAVYERSAAHKPSLLHLDHAPGGAAEQALAPLLGALAQSGPLHFERVPEAEHPCSRLATLGFASVARHQAYRRTPPGD